jgi:hypothetical protein
MENASAKGIAEKTTVKFLFKWEQMFMGTWQVKSSPQPNAVCIFISENARTYFAPSKHRHSTSARQLQQCIYSIRKKLALARCYAFRRGIAKVPASHIGVLQEPCEACRFSRIPLGTFRRSVKRKEAGLKQHLL